MGDSQPISGRCSRHLGVRSSKSAAVPIFLLVVALTAVGQPPEQMGVFRAVAEALANRDVESFLDQFDRQMPQYQTLRDEIQELVGTAQEIGSTIDVITMDGNTLELDWLLKIDTAAPRRQVVKCRVEKRGKAWKITALEPVEFFRK